MHPLQELADQIIQFLPNLLGSVIILLAGDTKRGQQRDIVAAQAHWEDYKRRKRGMK